VFCLISELVYHLLTSHVFIWFVEWNEFIHHYIIHHSYLGSTNMRNKVIPPNFNFGRCLVLGITSYKMRWLSWIHSSIKCLVWGITPTKMRWCIMSLFFKFVRMTTFLVLILTNYEEWGDNRSTYFIPETKQKMRSEKMIDNSLLN
jgi:hypothetical protein